MAEFPKQIAELIAKFDQNLEAYHKPAYGETEVRVEFINPFFEALGWDVTNKAAYAESFKDVIHEDAVKVGGATKAPDYSFRIGGTRKFFLEAKRPSIGIKDETGPAYQLRRYAWSAKLPLSILTNFAEFAVYHCHASPKENDKASTGRILYLDYKDYAPRWEEITAVFSKDAVLHGSFDKFAESGKGKRGTSQVDTEFLNEIESWRDALAKNLALRNPRLSVRDLNFAVQRTIDRVIFLRMCEDRGVEQYGQLLALLNGENIYKRLHYLYNLADDKYNSGLFHFKEEKGRAEPPDELTLKLKIDDKVLKDIIRRLYYPESPYEFSVLGADILGNVYEQFLGKVIRLTTGHQAKVEEKPEVKKAGGVYYTPAYIVDYIVKNTVGKLCEGKTPKQIEKLKVLDPACGSGSFLIGGYTYLLSHHRDWYFDDGPQKHTKEIYQGSGGQWLLTTQEKKRILLNNIYGVDIDSQAVEVTKLSLLLRVLEGESEETIGKSLKLFRERALPDLGDNIKCGNSLIGPDFYQNKQMSFLDDEERYRINVFDWDSEFAAIMKSGGGFDAVIGNPPWLMAGYYVKETLDYFRSKFKSAQGKFDMYYLFTEQGLRLASDHGVFGMIVPNKCFHTNAASELRVLLSKPKWIRSIVDFGDEQIFSGATNYSCILFLQKQPSRNPGYVKAKAGLAVIREFDVPWSEFSSGTWHFEEQGRRGLFKKLEKVGEPLERIAARFGTGVQSGADRLLTLDSAAAKATSLETALLRPILRGRDVRRYMVSDKPKLLIFPYKVQNGEFVILSETELKRHKKIYKLLTDNKEKMAKRVWFGKGAKDLSGEWYGMMYLDSWSSFSMPHILTPSLSNRSNFALGRGDLFVTGTAGVTSVIPKDGIGETILYLLGLLNSALLSLYAVSHSPIFSGGYYKFSAPYLRKLPIRRIVFSNPSDKTRHDKMVALVERMLDLHKQLPAAKNPDDKTRLQREIEATDRQLDQLVYELYGLTEEEIKIVERDT